jgi:uncharacterized protein with HEPN domain
MSTPDTPDQRLRQTRKYALIAIRFVGDRTMDTYLQDEGLNLIVERAIEVAGEALNRARQLDPTLEGDIPDLRVAVSVRNRIVHAYDEIDHVILYEAVKMSLPLLINQIDQVLEQRGW